MSGVQTAREALVAELLGDAGHLIDKLQAVQQSLPDAAADAVARIEAASSRAAGTLEEGSGRLRQDLAREREAMAKSLEATAKQAATAAQVVTGAAGRIALYCLLLGLLGGGIAGGIVGYFAGTLPHP